MKRVTLFSVAVVTLVAFAGTAASANDIVDFLRTVQGSSRHDHHAQGGRIAVADARRGRVHGGYSSRDVYKHHQLRHESAVRHGLPGYGYDRYGYDRRAYNGAGRGIRIGGSSASLIIRTGGQAGPAYYGNPGYVGGPQYVLPGDPGYSVVPPVPNALTLPPHQLGEIIDCQVPLATCVHIEDPENIAPNAIPTVVAVRDPSLCDHACDCCTERLVYVEVCVPPCPLRKMTISPCHTRIKMDFGDYEVAITSRNGVITIDYDN